MEFSSVSSTVPLWIVDAPRAAHGTGGHCCAQPPSFVARAFGPGRASVGAGRSIEPTLLHSSSGPTGLVGHLRGHRAAQAVWPEGERFAQPSALPHGLTACSAANTYCPAFSWTNCWLGHWCSNLCRMRAAVRAYRGVTGSQTHKAAQPTRGLISHVALATGHAAPTGPQSHAQSSWPSTSCVVSGDLGYGYLDYLALAWCSPRLRTLAGLLAGPAACL